MNKAALWMGWAAAMCSAAQVQIAQAQDEPSADASLETLADEARTRVRAAAGVWYAALSGDVRFGPESNSGTQRLDTFFGLEDDEAAFAGDVEIFIDERWFVWLNAFDFSTSADQTTGQSILINGVSYGAGTELTSDFGLTSLAATAGYDFFGNLYPMRTPDNTGEPVDIRVHALAGVRGINVDHRTAIGGGPTVAFDEWGAIACAGGRLAIGIGPDIATRGRWDVGVTITYGIGASAHGDLSAFDLQFSIRYTVLNNFGLQLGYRHMDVDIEADDGSQPYRWDGRIAGLFFGGELVF